MLNNFSVSLICCDPLNLEKDVEFLISKGVNQFHADFMDNTFVPRLGVYPEIIQKLKEKFKDKIFIDSHLMIDNPERCIDVIAPYSDWIFFHYEAQKDPLRIIQTIKKKYPNVKVGVAVNVLTVLPWTLQDIVDGILLMGISPGVLGTNHYSSHVLKKLGDIKNSHFTDFPVYIDGAVNFETIPEYLKTKKLGKNTVLVCGSSTVFKNVTLKNRYQQVEDNLSKIKSLLPKCLKEKND